MDPRLSLALRLWAGAALVAAPLLTCHVARGVLTAVLVAPRVAVLATILAGDRRA